MEQVESYWRVFRRAIILYLLGIFYHGAIGEPPQFRMMGVLHRIAICYLFAAPKQGLGRTFGLVMFVTITSIDNQQTYSFRDSLDL